MKKVLNLHNLSLLLVVIIISIFSTINVNATVTWVSSSNNVTITRSVTGVTIPVTNTFTYTITANASNPSGVTGAPTTGSVAMSSQAVSGTTATATGTINFNGMSFTQPGHYFYTITETGSTDQNRYPIDNTHTYNVEIAVINANTSDPNGTDYTAQVYVYNNASTPAKADANFTSASPQSQYGRILLSKSVTGNAANANMYFKLGIKIAGSGSTYLVSGLTANVTCGTTTQSSTTATITGGSSSFKYICLKSGQTATIGYKENLNQIPVGTRIDITEPSYSGDGYSGSYVLNGGSVQNKLTVTNYTMTAGDVTVAYTNTKSETAPPTGIIIAIIPYIIVVVVAIVSVLLFMRFKKKKQIINENQVL